MDVLNGAGDLDGWQQPEEVSEESESESSEEAVKAKPGKEEQRAAKRQEHLGKRLTYLLRYGALQEGLTVHQGGYIEIKQLLNAPLMRRNNRQEVLNLVSTERNHRNTPRYETKQENGTVYLRARHRQQLERSPYHEGTKVQRLLDTCLSTICNNITDYDFDGFPDLYLFNSIIHRLRRKKKLNNTTLRTVLAPPLEFLNLQGVYLTPATFKIITTQCPNLRILNLHGCGYILNDHYADQLFKKLPHLESLNISGAHHLTDRTLKSIVKHLQGLVHLVASGNRHFTERAVLDLVLSLSQLTHLDMYNNPNVSLDGHRTLIDIGRTRKLTVILKGLTDPTVAPEDPAMVLSVWREGLA